MRRRLFVALLGSAIVGWPAGAHAQQPMPVIGWLGVGSTPADNDFRLTAFRRGLSETGYNEGRNVAIEYRWAEGHYDRLPALAADLVDRQVTVIVAPGAPMAFAAKAATSIIPIVFNQGVDPVQSGLVASLNLPRGNITGVAVLTAELAGKRLELVHELVPAAPIVASLVNPANPVTESETKSLGEATRSLRLQHVILRASTPGEIDAAFGKLVELGAGALVVSGDPFFTNRREQIVILAARHAMPVIYAYRQYTAVGGLMSYGPDLADTFRLVGIYAGKILNGAKPADLPVEQITKVELVINLKTAKELGLTIPLALSGRADEVIE